MKTSIELPKAVNPSSGSSTSSKESPVPVKVVNKKSPSAGVKSTSGAPAPTVSNTEKAKKAKDSKPDIWGTLI